MFPNLPYELLIKVLHNMDYSTWSAFLQTSRETRQWALDNFSLFLKERPKGWNQHIPEDELKRLGKHFVKLFENQKPKPSLDQVKWFLLMGVDADTREFYKGNTMFMKCIDMEYFDIADIRNYRGLTS
jgi:hypothetical protein